MMRVLFIILLLIMHPVEAKKEKWEKTFKRNRLKFYKKKAKKSKLLKFRAIGEIKISTEEVLGILRDVKLTTKWDKNTIKKITLDNISDIEAITYSVANIPWPMSDRDMILNNFLYINREKKYLYILAKSIKHPKYKKKNSKYVRAKIRVEMRVRPKK